MSAFGKRFSSMRSSHKSSPPAYEAKPTVQTQQPPASGPSSATTAASSSLKSPIDPATRQSTGFSDPDAVPETDPSSTAGILAERLQAWKHAVGYLEAYMEATEKVHKSHAKEYERVLKTISDPLREGAHFDQSLGGVAGYFENMRSNTQALVNTNIETEKSIKGSVLPILARLHQEIKNKAKELANGAQKGAKEVEKSRNTTQKYIELLGQQTTAFESAGGRVKPDEDPYIVKRGVIHRLNQQVLNENNHRNDLIAVQSNFLSFESHVISTIQQAMEVFNSFVGGQAEKQRVLYSDMLGAAQRIPGDFEWKRFVERNSDMLVDPNEDPRTVDSITFPNMDHASTKPLIEGSLERKSRNKLSFGYSTGYYVVTPSKFLHEFKDSDNMRKDPTPELSIYLPDAVIGAPSGEKFNIKGKDLSKGLSSKLTGNAELAFKAHTAADAQRWFDIIKNVVGATGPAEPTSPQIGTSPSPPAVAEKKDEVAPAAAVAAPEEEDKLQLNEAQNVAATEQPASAVAQPAAAHPAAAHQAAAASPAAVKESAPAVVTDDNEVAPSAAASAATTSAHGKETAV